MESRDGSIKTAGGGGVDGAAKMAGAADGANVGVANGTMQAVNLAPVAEKRQRVRERRLWTGILAGMGVAIVALVVAVIVGVVQRNNVVEATEMTVEEKVENVEEANVASAAIIARFNDEEDEYGIEELEADFVNEMNRGNKARRVVVAIHYADFMYGFFADADLAAGILLPLAGEVDDSLAINLYVAIRRYYDDVGRTDEAEYYNALVGELMPEAEEELDYGDYE